MYSEEADDQQTELVAEEHQSGGSRSRSEGGSAGSEPRSGSGGWNEVLISWPPYYLITDRVGVYGITMAQYPPNPWMVQVGRQQTEVYRWKPPDDLTIGEAMQDRLSDGSYGLIRVDVALRNQVGEGRFGRILLGMGTFVTSAAEDPPGSGNFPTIQRELVLKILKNETTEIPEKRHFTELIPTLESNFPLEFVALTALGQNAHIVYLFDYAELLAPQERTADRVAFMQFLHGGTLAQYTERIAWAVRHDLYADDSEAESIPAGLEEVVLRGILIQVLAALSFIHYHGFAHMDLSLANIMANKHGDWKLVDFGLVTPYLGYDEHPKGEDPAKLPSVLSTEKSKVTYDVMPPEVLDNWIGPPDEVEAYLPYMCDVWELGCTAFAARTSCRPFPQRLGPGGPNLQAMLEDRKKNFGDGLHWHDVVLDQWDEELNVTDQFVTFLVACIALDPDDRHTVTALLAGDEWLSTNLENDPLLHYMTHAVIFQESSIGSPVGPQVVQVQAAAADVSDVSEAVDPELEGATAQLMSISVSDFTAAQKRITIRPRDQFTLNEPYPPAIKIPARLGLINAVTLLELFPASQYLKKLHKESGLHTLNLDIPVRTNMEGITAVLEERLETMGRRLLSCQWYDDWFLGRGGFGGVYRAIGSFFTGERVAQLEMPDGWRARPVLHNFEVVVKLMHDGTFLGDRVRLVSENHPSGVVHDAVFSSPIDFIALSALRHPNIVVLHDYGTYLAKQRWYAVMEFLQGGDLNRLRKFWSKYRLTDCLRDEHAPDLAVLLRFFGENSEHNLYGGMPDCLVRGFMRQIFEALRFSHHHGFAHMDIKPHNVLIDRHGTSKVADYGLAVPHAREGTDPETSMEDLPGNPLLAKMGPGTPNFMSPEAMRYKAYYKPPFHPRPADIYSMGIMAWQLLTGNIAFKQYSVLRDGKWRADYVAMLPAREAPTAESFWYTTLIPLFRKHYTVEESTVQTLRVMIEPNQAQRPTAEEMLTSDWLNPMNDPLERFSLGFG